MQILVLSRARKEADIGPTAKPPRLQRSAYKFALFKARPACANLLREPGRGTGTLRRCINKSPPLQLRKRQISS
jgi:hypothetical protein